MDIEKKLIGKTCVLKNTEYMNKNIGTIFKIKNYSWFPEFTNYFFTLKRKGLKYLFSMEILMVSRNEFFKNFKIKSGEMVEKNVFGGVAIFKK